MTIIFNLRKLAAAVTSIALLASGVPPLFADDDAAASQTFTLITGDVAHASVDRKGQIGAVRMTGPDGGDVFTSLHQVGRNVYAIPADAQALIDSGKLDLELFNVTRLYESGYGDAASASIPVIVEYDEGEPRGEVPGAQLTADFGSIDSAAMSVDKTRVDDAFRHLTTDPGVETVWLDQIVKAFRENSSLSPTVPLTGAQGAYALGYDGSGVRIAVLDTGYDFEHPDLQGKVVDLISFPFNSEGDDLDGHGTHVAGTIAGTGAESAGVYAGMAPGADLLVAKVLSDTGTGSTSWILAGMQWAVDNGADIISMSLGSSGAADCTGPLVDMVEAHSDVALFVIAAGNDFLRETVSTPGCAPSALTVGAIDRNNETANFSSRGPSVDGHTSKPDIASQGVNVVSAASGGSGDLAYRVLSGTSMATPHVAGGAALVLQANPELTPAQLKAALTSSVLASDVHVLEQGAGPMDVTRALDQPVIGAPNLSLGDFEYPYAAGVAESMIQLQNISDRNISLKVRGDIIGDDGTTKMPATLFRLGANHVDIAAGTTLDIPVSIDPAVALRNGAYGTITGRLVATETGNSDVQVTVPFSFWIEPPTVELTINAFDRHGNPATSPSSVTILGAEDQIVGRFGYTDGTRQISLPEGDYAIVTNIMTRDDPSNLGLVASVATMAELRVKLDQSKELTFNALDATELEFKADRPIDPQGFSVGYTYELSDDGLLQAAGVELAPRYVNHLYAWSQGHDSRYRFFTTTRAFAPQPILSTDGGFSFDYLNVSQAPGFNGPGQAEVVFGENGARDVIESMDIEGKVVLIDYSGVHPSQFGRYIAEGGGAGVLINVPDSVGRFNWNASGVTIPMVAITADTGNELHLALADGPLLLNWTGIAPERTPFAYSLAHIVDGRINAGQVRVHDHQLAAVDSAYHAQGDERYLYTDVFASIGAARNFFSTGSSQMLFAPSQRVELFTAGPEVQWTNMVMSGPVNAGGSFDGPRSFVPGRLETTTWMKAPNAATTKTNDSLLLDRDTNRMVLSLPFFGDAAGHDATGSFLTRDSRRSDLYLDGERIIPLNGAYTLPDSEHDLRLEVEFYRLPDFGTINQRVGVAYQTAWEFKSSSAHQGAQELIVPRIDVPSDLANTYPAGQTARINLGAIMDGMRPVDLVNVQVEYAHGDEAVVFGRWPDIDWLPAQANFDENGWFVEIPNDAEIGEYAHLKVTMEDQEGSSVEQLMLRVYLLD